jgi:WD40 repeat protein
MRLAVKMAVAFLFFSLVLYGFDDVVPAVIQKNELAPASAENTPQATKIADLPAVVGESSGIEEADKPGTFITHNDAGNTAELYKIDSNGKLLATIAVNRADNIDWEDLAKDNKGNIYIGDIGNNSNKRKRLKIYKLNLKNPENVEEIIFSYADRKAGNTENLHSEFDAEALFWYQSKLYIITKDHSKGAEARLYALPDQAGEHEAQPVSTQEVHDPVTSADISPDGKTLALLSKGKLHIFHPAGAGNLFGSKQKSISLGNVGQTEAAVFTDNNTLVLTNEEGKLYRLNL